MGGWRAGVIADDRIRAVVGDVGGVILRTLRAHGRVRIGVIIRTVEVGPDIDGGEVCARDVFRSSTIDRPEFAVRNINSDDPSKRIVAAAIRHSKLDRSIC